MEVGSFSHPGYFATVGRESSDTRIDTEWAPELVRKGTRKKNLCSKI
jgi:hypothetical protein